MKVSIGCDRAGFIAKESVKKHLMEKGYEIIDCGVYVEEICDYPIYAFKTAELVGDGTAEKGIVICSSGEGVCICANKVKNIRCGIGYNDEVTRLIVEHNHANMIAFGAKYSTINEIINRVDIFLNSIELGKWHQDRINMIIDFENK